MNTPTPHNKRFLALWGEREPESSGTYLWNGAYDT